MTKTQYNDLFDFLVNRFDRLETRMGNLEIKMGNLETRVGNVETRVGNVETTLDFVLREILTLNEEKTVGSYRSGRMESWIKKASKKIDLPYNY